MAHSRRRTSGGASGAGELAIIGQWLIHGAFQAEDIGRSGRAGESAIIGQWLIHGALWLIPRSQASPARAPSLPFASSEPQRPQNGQVFPHLPLRGGFPKPCGDFPKRQPFVRFVQERKDRSLAFGHLLPNLLRRHVPAREKPDDNAAAFLLNLRCAEASLLRQLRHFDRSASPRFYDADAVEHSRDQRVPWERFVRGNASAVRPKWSPPEDATSRRSS